MTVIDNTHTLARLGNLAEQIRGVSYKNEEAVDAPIDGYVPLLRAGNIEEYGLNFDDLVYVPKERVSSKQMLRKGDIVIAASSGSIDVVGKAALCTEDWHGSFGAFCKVLRPNRDISADYLAYFLRTPYYRHVISNLAAGVNINNLRNEHLDNLEIPLPSLPEQRRIVTILDKADAIRCKRAAAIRLADDFLKSAFLDLVGPGSTSYERWPEKTIAELAAAHRGAMRTGPFGSNLRHSEFVDEGIAVLGIDNAVNNRFEWAQRRFITEEKYEELKQYTVYPGDVIITIMGTTGRTAVVPEDIPTAISTKHLTTITPNRKLVHPQFIAFSVRENPDVLHQIAMASKGAIMDGLNLTIIKDLRLRVPPLEVQDQFEALVTRTEKTRDHLLRLQDEANKLFSSLVQRSFRGAL